jgi:hypothetical protein
VVDTGAGRAHNTPLSIGIKEGCVRRSILVCIVIAIGTAAAAVSAEAREQALGLRGFGPRVGVSLDPNQIVLGGHGDFGDLFPQTTWLLPVLEVGLGDNVTVVSLGTDLLIRGRDRTEAWNPYGGGELALLFTSTDGGRDNSDLGLSGVLGLEKGISRSHRFATEIKFSVIDAPNVKLTAIWTFAN